MIHPIVRKANQNDVLKHKLKTHSQPIPIHGNPHQMVYLHDALLFVDQVNDKPQLPDFVTHAMNNYDSLLDMLTHEYFDVSTEEVDDDTLFCWIDANFDTLCQAWYTLH